MYITLMTLMTLIKGGVLKYLLFLKMLFHGQKRKKIYSPTHLFLLIKTCIHETHKILPLKKSTMVVLQSTS